MLQVRAPLGGGRGPGWAGRTTGAVLTALHTSQRKITALVQGKELNASQKYYLLLVNIYFQSDPDTGKEEVSCEETFVARCRHESSNEKLH